MKKQKTNKKFWFQVFVPYISELMFSKYQILIISAKNKHTSNNKKRKIKDHLKECNFTSGMK